MNSVSGIFGGKGLDMTLRNVERVSAGAAPVGFWELRREGSQEGLCSEEWPDWRDELPEKPSEQPELRPHP